MRRWQKRAAKSELLYMLKELLAHDDGGRSKVKGVSILPENKEGDNFVKVANE